MCGHRAIESQGQLAKHSSRRSGAHLGEQRRKASFATSEAGAHVGGVGSAGSGLTVFVRSNLSLWQEGRRDLALGRASPLVKRIQS